MKALLSLALLAALACAALAQSSYVVSGELTATDPRFTRPSDRSSLSEDGPSFAYDAYAFTVDQTGTYVGEMFSPAFDTYLLVYRDAFNPAAPLTNLINGDDDFGGTLTVLSGTSAGNRGSRIAAGDASNYAAGGLALTAGTTYYAVATAFSRATSIDGLGEYRVGIGGGPGNVRAASAVPEPATMAALGLGAAALLRRKRRSA